MRAGGRLRLGVASAQGKREDNGDMISVEVEGEG